ncbi:MAG: hypothetical protein JNK72_18035 [Myxococcales bacterium]|nr:hypothetical protein [Myxococcales bacterium]
MKAPLTLSLCLLSLSAAAQRREPLCAVVDSRRVLSAPHMAVNGSDRLVAQRFLSPGAGPSTLVAVRDPERSLRIAGRPRGPRALSTLEWSGPHRNTGNAAPGLVVVRLDDHLDRVGEAMFIEDPIQEPRGHEETFAPGIPVGVPIDDGVMLFEHIGGDLYGVLVGPEGQPGPLRRLAEAPREDGHGGFTWITAAPRRRDGQQGAVVLAGTAAGEVMALGVDAHGAPIGHAALWGQRVGGTMQLFEGPEGAQPVALLERPVRGTTLHGEQAREQVLVRLRDTLEPNGTPERVGLGPYETAGVLRDNQLVLTQWAEMRGLAVSTVGLDPSRLAIETPHIWTTQPLDGIALGHRLVLGPDNIAYDFVLNGDTTAGGLHGYLTYLPRAGTPFARRELLPLRARVIARPELLASEDGVVVFMATYDELGGGVDAVHLRCDMVTLPER